MANLVRDLAGYNRKITVNSDTIQFTGQYAQGVSDADFATLTQNRSGEFVLGNPGEFADGGLQPYVTAQQTAIDNAANAALASNQQTQQN